MNIKGKKVVSLILGATMCLALTAGTAWAYFTDTVDAKGQTTLRMGSHTEIDEHLDKYNKDIVIQNTGEVAALARIQVLYGNMEAQGIKVTIESGDGWAKVGKWYYYVPTLEKKGVEGDSSSHFKVKVETTDPKANELLDQFDVVVVQQSSMLMYNEQQQRVASFDDEIVVWPEASE